MPIKSHTKNSSYYNNSREGNKKYTDWEGRNKTIFLCRLNDCLCRKFQRIDQNKTEQNPPQTLELINNYSRVAG